MKKIDQAIQWSADEYHRADARLEHLKANLAAVDDHTLMIAKAERDVWLRVAAKMREIDADTTGRAMLDLTRP